MKENDDVLCCGWVAKARDFRRLSPVVSFHV